MRRLLVAGLTLFSGIVLATGSAHAQASITGSIRDTSGGVLPGVTVEASSPALIEQSRSVVTDSTGQYRIVDLRPGVYTVRFTLPGFSTVVREGIELTGSFTASVNVELRVGALAETITVTGESPMVDVQNAGQQRTMDKDLIAAIPTGRQYFSFTALIPAINAQGNDVGGLSGPMFSVFQAHGGRRNEGRVSVEGLGVGWQGMGVSTYVPDMGNAQEVSFTLSGGLGEAETGGPAMNIIPRQGGNTFSGTLFATGANAALQGSNFTQAHRDAGLRAPNELKKLWDVNAAFGGPVARDRLWFYLAARNQGNRKLVAGMWHNKNAGDLSKWTYEPDYDRQALDDGTWQNASLRLTWQASPRNKVNVYWDEQHICLACVDGGGTATQSPESVQGQLQGPLRVRQVSWTSPVTSRLLLEFNYGVGPSIQWGAEERPGNNRDLIQVTDQAGVIPNLTYRARHWSRPHGTARSTRAAVSYITGAHSMKAGFTHTFFEDVSINFVNNHRLTYRFRNGVPNQLTMIGNHASETVTQATPIALFVQEQWTRGRLTLQGGVRYEHVGSHFPEQRVGPERFIPVALVFPAQDSPVNMHDIVPRMGASYDLFGTGKTALKVTLGKYFSDPARSGGIYAGNHNPKNRVATTTSRSWTDQNGNFVPDCDLLNPATNGECGPWSNQSFGRDVPTTTYDPAIIDGWGVREYNWDFAATVQHELLPRLSLEVGYVRRVWGNFNVTDNRAVGPGDFDPYCITVPVDARLADSGKAMCDLYDVRPAKFGQIDNYVTASDNFGTQTDHYNGVDFTIDARLRNGLTVRGGFSTGRSVTDQCDVAPKIDSPSRRFCHLETPFLTQVKGLAAYTIPRVDLLVSGTFQSKPFVGANNPTIADQSLAANWVVSNALVAPSLGRNLSGSAANVTVNVVEPGTMYGDRLNQIDFRVAKILRFGGKRTQIGLDLYNVLNSSVVESYVRTYGPQWLAPTAITPARFAKLSAQIDF
jgi:hypothetical protein